MIFKLNRKCAHGTVLRWISVRDQSASRQPGFQEKVYFMWDLGFFWHSDKGAHFAFIDCIKEISTLTHWICYLLRHKGKMDLGIENLNLKNIFDSFHQLSTASPLWVAARITKKYFARRQWVSDNSWLIFWPVWPVSQASVDYERKRVESGGEEAQDKKPRILIQLGPLG